MRFYPLPALYRATGDKTGACRKDRHMKNEESFEPHYTEGSLPERFDSWITQVLENLIYTEVRSYKRRKMRLPEFTTENIDEIASYDPDKDEELKEILLGNTPLILKSSKLAAALPKISPRKQQVIEGTIVLGIPVKIVAETMGLSEHIVSNYKYLGLNELRAMMEGDKDE